MVSRRIIALAVWVSGGKGDGWEGTIGDARGISHKPLSVRRPSIIILLFFRILTLKREKIAMQSSSQSCPREISDHVCILSNMTTCWALVDSSGDKCICAFDVGEMISPFATVT